MSLMQRHPHPHETESCTALVPRAQVAHGFGAAIHYAGGEIASCSRLHPVRVCI